MSSQGLDLTQMKAPPGQEDLKDALGNYIYARPEVDPSKLESLSKKELREQKKAEKKNKPKPKELKRVTFD